jgi:hypothetical protein
MLDKSLYLPQISLNNITEYVFNFFNITADQATKLLECDWKTYKFLSNSITLTYKIENNTCYILTDIKTTYPKDILEHSAAQHVSAPSECLQKEKTEIEVSTSDKFLNIYRKHLQQTYVQMINKHQYPKIEIPQIEYNAQAHYDVEQTYISFGQNKSVYVKSTDKTYLFHTSIQFPVKICTYLKIKQKKFNNTNYVKSLLENIIEYVNGTSTVDNIFNFTDITKTTESIIVPSVTKIYDVKNIPIIYLSKTFIPRYVELKHLNFVNKKTIKLLKQFESIGKSLFKIFR